MGGHPDYLKNKDLFAPERFNWRLVQKKKIRSPNYFNSTLIFKNPKIKKKKLKKFMRMIVARSDKL